MDSSPTSITLFKATWILSCYAIIIRQRATFGTRRFRSSENTEQIVISNYSNPVDFTLKTANQSFRLTLPVVMTNQHTKLGSKEFSSPADSGWANTGGFGPHRDQEA